MKWTRFIVGGAMMLTVAACGSKNNQQETNSEIFYSTSEASADGSLSVSASEVAKDITWKSVVYHYDIKRTPDERLPKVKDETGDTFIDNRIALTITKGDAPFFQKEFTKESFASLLDEGFMKNGVLEGITFYQTTDAAMLFTVSVNYPQSDLYMPILLSISANGSMEIMKDNSADEYYGGE